MALEETTSKSSLGGHAQTPLAAVDLHLQPLLTAPTHPNFKNLSMQLLMTMHY